MLKCDRKLEAVFLLPLRTQSFSLKDISRLAVAHTHDGTQSALPKRSYLNVNMEETLVEQGLGLAPLASQPCHMDVQYLVRVANSRQRSKMTSLQRNVFPFKSIKETLLKLFISILWA